MAVGAVLAYTTPVGSYSAQILLIALIFFLFGSPCSMVWVLFGRYLRRFLSEPNRLRLFNISMSVLLVVSLIPALKSLPVSSWLHG
nr:hypothetical protein [Pseudomonas chlororaphis]